MATSSVPMGPTSTSPVVSARHADRDLGIPVMGQAPWGTHFCQFYRTKLDLIDTVVPYFRSGLDNHELCVWITSEPLEAVEAAAAMRASVPGFGDAIRDGQIEILPYTDWYLQGSKMDFDWTLAALVTKLRDGRSRGFDGLRVSGNSFWLQPHQWNDFAEYEATINRTIGRYPMIALCTYSLDKCGPSEIRDVLAHHQMALAKDNDEWALMDMTAGIPV